MELVKEISPRKVWFSRTAIALFNARWPGASLRASRAYWFEFDEDGDLIDTDVPEHEDGAQAAALAEDALAWLQGRAPAWLTGVET